VAIRVSGVLFVYLIHVLYYRRTLLWLMKALKRPKRQVGYSENMVLSSTLSTLLGYLELSLQLGMLWTKWTLCGFQSSRRGG
jgi:hypothetical protein